MMGSESHVYHRRSIRLKEYDYSQADAYFVTICTHKRKCLFGRVEDGRVQLSNLGRMVASLWNDLPKRYPSVTLDELTVMPNHIHGIICIVGAGLALPQSVSGDKSKNAKGAASRAPTLGDVICAFKSMSSVTLNKLLQGLGRSPWQRNYYEHVIRNECELGLIREYIVNNPAQWSLDRENPDCLEQRRTDYKWQV